MKEWRGHEGARPYPKKNDRTRRKKKKGGSTHPSLEQAEEDKHDPNLVPSVELMSLLAGVLHRRMDTIASLNMTSTHEDMQEQRKGVVTSRNEKKETEQSFGSSMVVGSLRGRQLDK